jgi:phosphatidylinositol alpha-mannosyltransferase
MARVRVGLVSPYSYTYPGGVGRHVESLADELLEQGHDVRLLAPYDPDDRHARIAHRGARPQRRPVPDHFVSLGRTVGLPMNGAVSNLSASPPCVAVLGQELRRGDYDVIHVHEPNAPVVSWFATAAARQPLVATFHTYSTSPISNRAAVVLGARRLYNKLHLRIAVSEAARWTAERFYGGRYRIVPNGVDLAAARPQPFRPDGPLRILFVGRAEERKGLPVLLRAFEALRIAGVDAELTVAGATEAEAAPYLLDSEGVEVRGRVSEQEKWRLLGEADVLCAPSLAGESFGMVLTEAFASGTPVVCSDLPGYREVVHDEVEGVLVRPGDPVQLGETLRRLAAQPERRRRMATAARERAKHYAWPEVTREVVALYEEAAELKQAAERSATRPQRAAIRAGVRPADLGPREPARRLPSLEADRHDGRRRAARVIRRGAVAAGAVAAAGLSLLALKRLGIESIAGAVLHATPVWVLVAFGLMCLSMLMRAEAWHATLRAALPGTRVRRRDAARGTMIGVLMSATLPARLGEPSRALIVARRLGRVRNSLPVVVGTLVSQTLLNIVALAGLGIVMFSTVGIFRGNEDALVAASIAPLLILVAVLLLPLILRQAGDSRFTRVRRATRAARAAMVQVRSGLRVFRTPRLGCHAALFQLSAWLVQWLACYALLMALGLDERAGIGAAAAVLFAVNVTAVLPALPSNVGVFQAACIAVLAVYGVRQADALAYGVILQGVEIATAFALGMPALVGEGLSWRDMRVRAMHTSPVELTSEAEEAAA